MRILNPQWSFLVGRSRRRAKQARHWRQKAALLGILVLLGYAILAPRNNIITVEARTETVSYVVKNAELSLLNAFGAQVFVDPFSDVPEFRVDEQGSYLKPTENTKIQITKHESSDSAYLSLSSDGSSVGTLFSGTDEVVLGAWASLKFAASAGWDSTIIIPFRAELTLGEDVAPGVEAILLSGSVSIAEEQLGLFGQERYLLQTTDLEQGDRIRILPQDGGSVVSDGFIRISSEGASSVVAHTNNCVVRVVRFGSAGYQISPSAWARLSNDPGLSWLTALLGILLLSTELILALSSFFARRGESDADDSADGDEVDASSVDTTDLGSSTSTRSES